MSPRAGDMECVAIARNSACNLGFDFANKSPSYAIRPSLLIVLKFGTQRVALQTQLQQAWGPDVNKDGFNWALTAGEQSVAEFQNSEGAVFRAERRGWHEPPNRRRHPNATQRASTSWAEHCTWFACHPRHVVGKRLR